MLIVMFVMIILMVSIVFSNLKYRGVKKIIGVKFRLVIDKL